MDKRAEKMEKTGLDEGKYEEWKKQKRLKEFQVKSEQFLKDN